MIRRLLIALFFVALPQVTFALQSKNVKANGAIGFYISTTAVTRLSVVGDRIKRVILDGTAFEMTNDEHTGDVFFRSAEGNEATSMETGYVITEKGHTITFQAKPVNRAVEPVIVKLAETAKQAEPTQTSIDAGGYTDSVAAKMTDIVRAVAAKHVLDRAVPKRRNGSRVAQDKGNGWSARVLVATGGKSGRLVREQEFYRAGVRAVWVVKPALAANERTFVIVVEE